MHEMLSYKYGPLLNFFNENLSFKVENKTKPIKPKSVGLVVFLSKKRENP